MFHTYMGNDKNNISLVHKGRMQGKVFAHHLRPKTLVQDPEGTTRPLIQEENNKPRMNQVNDLK